MTRLEKESQWLRAPAKALPSLDERLELPVGRSIGVDREKNILRGYVVAELGPFKSAGRGEFDGQSLDTIVSLMRSKAGGLKSRFTHPTLSGDGLGKFLGRARDPWRDGNKVRADLHFDPTALDTPPEGGKPLGLYVMDLAESDPGALSSSLVLATEKVYQLDDKGRPKTNDKGEELPPLWRPTKLHASDVVDTGDAVNDILSHSLSGMGLPDEIVRQASELLDTQFAGASAEVIRARSHAWLEQYLSWRFPDEVSKPDGSMEIAKRRLRLMELETKK